jgi:hypothetical protein
MGIKEKAMRATRAESRRQGQVGGRESWRLWRTASLVVLGMLIGIGEIDLYGQTTRPRPRVTSPRPATTPQTQTLPPSPSRQGEAELQFAHQHGYRAGYDDGHAQGGSDFTAQAPREVTASPAYRQADRTYTVTMGLRTEYQEGYRLGFELGYLDGYFGRPAVPAIPVHLRQIVFGTLNARETGLQTAAEVPTGQAPESQRYLLPNGVEMKIRLTSPIDTRSSQEGDRFTAVALDPTDYADGVIEGHIAKLRRSGRATGRTELVLAFDRIRLRDGRSGAMAGQVERVYESETVKTIDEEGTVQSGNRSQETTRRTVGGGAIGAILGGIAGGAKGAIIGAAVGVGAGVGSVLIQGGKDLVLEPGTELLIRTAAPTSSGERSR